MNVGLLNWKMSKTSHNKAAYYEQVELCKSLVFEYERRS